MTYPNGSGPSQAGRTDYREFRETYDALQEGRKRAGVERLWAANDRSLTVSAAGRTLLASRELEVPGLYNDPHVGTYGIGHVVHHVFTDNKGSGGKATEIRIHSMLLDAALADPDLKRRFVRRDTIKAASGTPAAKVTFLSRSLYLGAPLAEQEKLKNAALDLAGDFVVSQSTVKDLSAPGARDELAQTFIDTEVGLLGLLPVEVFKRDLPQYEQIVRNALGATRVSQQEFDALVHLVFNTGAGPVNHTKSQWSAMASIDQGQRTKNAVEMERKIKKYCLSGPKDNRKVNPELVKRRAEETERILSRTREESAALAALEALRARLASKSLP
jgi:GH24 family phage-related lysozyme (muramidase)